MAKTLDRIRPVPYVWNFLIDVWDTTFNVSGIGFITIRRWSKSHRALGEGYVRERKSPDA